MTAWQKADEAAKYPLAPVGTRDNESIVMSVGSKDEKEGEKCKGKEKVKRDRT